MASDERGRRADTTSRASREDAERRAMYARSRADSVSGMEKLEANPVFKKVCVDSSALQLGALRAARAGLALNLVASDGRGRLFVWNSQEKLLHYVDIHRSDSLPSGSGVPALFANKNFKVCVCNATERRSKESRFCSNWKRRGAGNLNTVCREIKA